ncbi:MAG: YicC/YloC family endoribonuclease [Phenylobacterium sp.]|uniref:YicC/YloC family endoribonuclease n=1 Tax=Phenylobacterium sp. TaxID=1871053 RepID=UPI0027227F4E|nr:YicC/YloC family endoribonuclease [Phenylobacterium sp.]MDO8899917.1 YicC/YloC family endoribonuclease [Phenylobacterium sp.]
MSISGMTGFGRVDGALGDWTWSAEARSVNGRNLDVRFRGPPGFEALERIAREGAQARFQRGQVTIGLQAKRVESQAQVKVNLEQAERYLAAVAGLVADGRAAPPRVDGLLALRGVIEVTEADPDPEALARVEAAMGASLTEALDALQLAREAEGAALMGVLAGQTDRIADLTAAAASLAGEQPAVLKARFARRMRELIGDPAGLEERIVQEAAAMAVKADVREELDRLAGHVDSARALLNGDGPVGRRLDFLTQEFMREANTLCSKSALSPLTAVGLELKATIEQLREQVQNVE